MTDLFDVYIPKLSYKPLFLKKYIDDILITAPECKIDETLDVFNSFRVNFFHEVTVDRKINFLDFTLIGLTNKTS